MKKDPSEKINIPDLRYFDIPVQFTAVPKTPRWTDRSRNGQGFHCTYEAVSIIIDPNGTGDKKYRRN